jgi:SAM-dependent methyltransferase
MTSQWYDFYRDRLNNRYERYFMTRYSPFLDAIIATKASVILEAGCGIASVSKQLVKEGIRCYGFDNDSSMLALSKKNVPQGGFVQGDILSLDIGSNKTLTVTHGVLEHFKDEQIECILSRFPNSIHYVPLDKYTTPSFGDERLLSAEYWENNFKLKECFTFNDGYDLCFKSNY